MLTPSKLPGGSTLGRERHNHSPWCSPTGVHCPAKRHQPFPHVNGGQPHPGQPCCSRLDLVVNPLGPGPVRNFSPFFSVNWSPQLCIPSCLGHACLDCLLPSVAPPHHVPSPHRASCRWAAPMQAGGVPPPLESGCSPPSQHIYTDETSIIHHQTPVP